jgi:hypothetical protein
MFESSVNFTFIKNRHRAERAGTRLHFQHSGRQRQDDHKFKASLDYVARLCFKKTNRT